MGCLTRWARCRRSSEMPWGTNSKSVAAFRLISAIGVGILLVVALVGAAAVTADSTAHDVENGEVDFRAVSEYSFASDLLASTTEEQSTAVEWKTELSRTEWVRSSPTVVDGTVFIGSDRGGLHAVDVDSGNENWFKIADDRVRSSPTVDDDTVYFGTQAGTVYAINATTGEEEWEFADPSGIVRSSPTVVDGTVFITRHGSTFADEYFGEVYAIDADTGEEEWSFETSGDASASPTVVDGVVYISSEAESRENSTLYAIDVDTGEKKWSHKINSLRSSVTVSNGTVFATGGYSDRGVVAIDAATGEREWYYETAERLAPRATPTVADGIVYVGTWDGLYAIDAESGEFEWRFIPSDDEFYSSPTVADGIVFVGRQDDHGYAGNATTGVKEWSFETNDRVWSSPTVVDGTVYIGSDDGNLYALEAGIDGKSMDSRVMLGTLGHHHLTTTDTDSLSAVFTWDPLEPEVGEEVTFDASDASSPNGDIVEYRWDFTGDGTIDEITTDPMTTHSYDEAGDYDVTLTVEDEVGATGSEREFLTVLTVATRLASFDVQPVSDPVVQGEPIELEFVNAVDVDGDPYTTGDDTLTNIYMDHPSDDVPRGFAVEFVDGEALHTFEILDGDETDDLELDTYEDLEAWEQSDPRISDTYDVEIVSESGPTPTPVDDTGDEPDFIDGDGSGFGPVVALLAIVVATLVARRRYN